MDRGYEGFCLVDPLFYDSPTVARIDDVDFALAAAGPPVGWSRDELEDWLVYTPVDSAYPQQGWKIHVSATLDNAEKVLAAVWDYCIPRGIGFKFVRSRQLLLLANGKYAHRGSSGKFVTIYPIGEVQLETVVVELGAALDGLEGPYILSDLRWNDGPLYLRYGAFAERYCVGPNGEPVPAIEDGSGDLVPDRRGTTFYLPPWVKLPEFLQPHLTARSAITVEDMPYRIDRPLHFSNGGGVYHATDRRTGEAVVLKEARPHAGLDADGLDAVSRLRHEREMLDRLVGLDVVPTVLDYFTLAGHDFLVLEYVEATVLSHTLVDRYPLALLGDDLPFDEYTAWALELSGRVERAIAAVHGRGIVIGDLHPHNVLVRPDGRITVVDLEIASDVAEGRRPTLGDPAFSSPADRTGFDIDLYAVACLRLFLFMPLTELIGLDPTKAAAFAADIAETFPVPAEFLQDAVRVIDGVDVPSVAAARASAPPRIEADPASWPALRDSMAKAIISTATPDRDDRLFPGDIKQFETGGLNLAFGAAGVLHTLNVTGAGRHPEYEDWLVHRAVDPAPGTRLGFWDGLSGVAFALEGLDRHSDAMEILQICVDELDGAVEDLGLDLFGGLAGIGLNLAHFATVTGDATLWDTTMRLTEIVADEFADPDDADADAAISGGSHPYAGLFRGATGPALLFLRCHDRFGDDQLLDLAATALRRDLRRCVTREDGALEVNEGFRTMPYLLDGSIGIGLVLDDYLARRDDDDFAAAAASIRIAAHSQFYVEPGLFSGRAGMILALSRTAAPGGGATDPMVAAHLRRLAWHAVNYRGQIAFPGDQLLRLSMDVATGTAGVLLAAGAALHDQPVHLPFLGPVTRTVPRDAKGGE